ncbi:HAD-like protein [Coccomyxa subellipsoidea C-169]|uniref:HAD-like protein n=1 Tax=Coccomyxa subellipsoidea (strain C-169) TaxID=574566 RepID=I0YLI8_COCSC|nr:HAD-like protein [Coccomyxa subellipsoidea C-169]EIE19257.1 HAD-like protein [Coccomyxa subellipsoidea C-169]|eukprot:XP_005643801.1 HAD-like protein [Coccomyxa subellipsoidea C-169]
MAGTRKAERIQHSTSCLPTAVEAAETIGLKALIFDCDGVILLSEDLHRVAYNAAFEHFQIKCNGQESIANWSEEFYDKLQNSIGGGKPKMRWFFGEYGWPISTVLQRIPETDEEKAQLIDTLQDWKTDKYQQIVSSGEVPAREGVLRLMDEARAEGLLVGVCSAATKSSAICVLESLLGKERFQSLDVFMAGDDVEKKKPDPSIYRIAAQRLGVDPSECLVVEDSTIGLKAALGAGMRCIITYTSSTRDQDFDGAERILEGLADKATLAVLSRGGPIFDDRIAVVAPA